MKNNLYKINGFSACSSSYQAWSRIVMHRRGKASGISICILPADIHLKFFMLVNITRDAGTGIHTCADICRNVSLYICINCGSKSQRSEKRPGQVASCNNACLSPALEMSTAHLAERRPYVGEHTNIRKFCRHFAWACRTGRLNAFITAAWEVRWHHISFENN